MYFFLVQRENEKNYKPMRETRFEKSMWLCISNKKMLELLTKTKLTINYHWKTCKICFVTIYLEKDTC